MTSTQAAAGSDSVKPGYYWNEAGFDVIEVIERYALCFHLGNALKYVVRAGKKGPAIADLRKAREYIERWEVRSDDWMMLGTDGLYWKDPGTICTAFGLGGWRRTFVRELLMAAATSNEGMHVASALAALDLGIAETEDTP